MNLIISIITLTSIKTNTTIQSTSKISYVLLLTTQIKWAISIKSNQIIIINRWTWDKIIQIITNIKIKSMDPLLNITMGNRCSIKIMRWTTMASINQIKGLNTKTGIIQTKVTKWTGLIARHIKEITTIFKTYLKKEMLIKLKNHQRNYIIILSAIINKSSQ